MVSPCGVDFDEARYDGFARLARPDEILPVTTKPTDQGQDRQALGLDVAYQLQQLATEASE
jgi:hypothetical protein